MNVAIQTFEDIVGRILGPKDSVRFLTKSDRKLATRVRQGYRREVLSTPAIPVTFPNGKSEEAHVVVLQDLGEGKAIVIDEDSGAYRMSIRDGQPFLEPMATRQLDH